MIILPLRIISWNLAKNDWNNLAKYLLMALSLVRRQKTNGLRRRIKLPIMPNLKKKKSFGSESVQFYVLRILNTLCFALTVTCIATGKKVKFLTAVLNSRVSHYQLFNLAPKTGTGDLIVSVQAVEPLLVPPITDANRHLVNQIESLVDKIIAAKTINPDADVLSLENEIDRVVYSLYGLTAEEIAIVEGEPMSKPTKRIFITYSHKDAAAKDELRERILLCMEREK